MKCLFQSKEAVTDSGEGLKYRYKHDRARTPFERLGDKEGIDEGMKKRLEAIRESVNPRQLRKEIYRLLDELWELVEEERRWTETEDKELTAGQTVKKGGRAPVTLSVE